MKRYIKIICISIGIFLLCCNSVCLASYGSTSPKITGTAAYLYCATTDEGLWGKNAEKQHNIASITKLMTCLVALENLELSEEIEVCEEATKVKKEDSFVHKGEIITVENLVYGALLSSKNDAAKALALAVCDNQKEFAKLMNQKAKSLGCTNTNFVNASGIYQEKQYSCASDVAKIAKAAFQNQDIRRIAGVTSYTVPATNKAGERKLESTNLLLNGGEFKTSEGKVKVKAYPGVFAGKTGTTNLNRTTMVVACEMDGFEIFAVILDSTSKERYEDIKILLNYAKDILTPYEAFPEGQGFGTASLKGGKVNRVEVVAETSGVINLPEGASASLVSTQTVFTENLTAPIAQGQRVGTVQIFLADEMIREVDLLTKEPVETGWFLSPLGITNAQTILIFLCVAVFVGTLLTILILRRINKKKRALRRKERLMEIARQQKEREYDVKQRNWPY